MRHLTVYPLLAAALLSVSAYAQSSGPFARPSITQKWNSSATEKAAESSAAPAVGLTPEEAVAAAKLKALEERRKKSNLLPGQELVEIPFVGSRVGTVNGVNVYRPTSKTASYYFEDVSERKYAQLPSDETYYTPAAEVPRENLNLAGNSVSPSGPPSVIGRPAPQK